MLFACYDWETLRNDERTVKAEVTVSKFEEEPEAKGCKHKTKSASKAAAVEISTESA